MNKETFSVVDVMQVRHDQKNPESAVKHFQLPDKMNTVECDVLITGGSVGGVAAALSAQSLGNLKICLTEETDWLGGQITSQGVPVLDEGKNFLVETSGANKSYQQFRERIREYYKQNHKLSAESLAKKYFTPGNNWYWVSQLSFEPQVAANIISELITSREAAASTKIFLRHTPVKIECKGNRIERILMVSLDTAEWTAFKAAIYIDATELGQLLALSDAQYNIGSESKDSTGEPHASAMSDCENVQDYTFPFVVEFVPGTDNTISKPHLYDYFNEQKKYSLYSYKMFDYADKLNNDGVVIDKKMPFWTYRRILDKTAFDDPSVPNDVAVINWMSNDFRGHNIIDKPPHIVSEYLGLAKACSLGFLYWLQTEAPRDDGGKGYPEIRLKANVLGTQDGLSKYPYIRESRRGSAFTIIKEQDIADETNPLARAHIFDDSVGIGFFPIDIHGKDAPPTTLNPTKHFQIPLSAMLMEFPSNLILACKNIGTTHITNGAYRLHPVEWAIGEAAGTLALHTLQNKTVLHEVLKHTDKLRAFQRRLILNGVPLFWYDDVPSSHPGFEAIQFLSITNIMCGDPGNLHFKPDVSLNQEVVYKILSAASIAIGCELPAEIATQLPVPIARADFASWLYSKI